MSSFVFSHVENGIWLQGPRPKPSRPSPRQKQSRSRRRSLQQNRERPLGCRRARNGARRQVLYPEEEQYGFKNVCQWPPPHCYAAVLLLAAVLWSVRLVAICSLAPLNGLPIRHHSCHRSQEPLQSFLPAKFQITQSISAPVRVQAKGPWLRSERYQGALEKACAPSDFALPNAGGEGAAAG